MDRPKVSRPREVQAPMNLAHPPRVRQAAAAVTAALDSRVAAVAPFNFGEAMPETSRFIPYKNLWPLNLAEPSPADWDTSRVIRRNLVDQFLQWFICASVAPRRFMHSYELG